MFRSSPSPASQQDGDDRSYVTIANTRLPDPSMIPFNSPQDSEPPMNRLDPEDEVSISMNGMSSILFNIVAIRDRYTRRFRVADHRVAAGTVCRS
jgi:hypothetical protein